MEKYEEQTVVKKKPGFEKIAYYLAYVLLVMLIIGAVFAVMGITGVNEAGNMTISWVNVIILVISAGLALFTFIYKDRFLVEYDYCLFGDDIEVSRVFNAKRRKKAGKIAIGTISMCGPAEGPAFTKAQNQPGLKLKRWYLNDDESLYFVCYTEQNEKCLAVLELNSEMAELLRTSKALQKGVWYNAEGKSSSYAGISR